MENQFSTFVTEYDKDPTNADNLTNWGVALLEKSHSQAFPESKTTVSEAILKFEAAVALNCNNHKALWLLGNAKSALAFLISDVNEAKRYFDEASKYFQLVVNEDPNNGRYLRSLQMCAKCPDLHYDIHKKAQEAIGVGPSSSTTTGNPKKSHDLYFDILGWLAIGIVAWVLLYGWGW